MATHHVWSRTATPIDPLFPRAVERAAKQCDASETPSVLFQPHQWSASADGIMLIVPGNGAITDLSWEKMGGVFISDPGLPISAKIQFP